MGGKETLARQVAIRVSQGDMDRLDELAGQIPVATRNAIARMALRLGLDALVEDPTRIVQQPPGKRRQKRA